MSEVQIFRNPDINAAIRTVLINSEPWFVAADACRALDISDIRQAVERLDIDERGGCAVPTPGGVQQMRVVSEAGLYQLVFGSSKPEAKVFRRWIAHDVLPSLRKTGTYSVKAPMSYIESLRAAADALEAKELLESQLVVEQKRTQAIVDFARPRVAFAERVAVASDEHTLRETAKLLSYKPNQLTSLLVHDAVVHRSNKRLLPYQRYIDNGCFRVRVVENHYGTYVQPVVTRRGLVYLARKYQRALPLDIQMMLGDA